MNEEVAITTQDITERLTIATKRGPKLNDNAAIKACCEEFTAFMADNREIYIIIKKEDITQEVDINSEEAAAAIRSYLMDKSGLYDLSSQIVKKVRECIKTRAIASNQKVHLNTRTCYDHDQNSVLIDQDDRSTIVIAEDGIRKETRKTGIFKRNPAFKPQVEYERTPASEAKELFGIMTGLEGSNLLLAIVYIVCAIYSKVKQLPLIFIAGNQGSGKTTVSRAIINCIDPTYVNVLTVPNNERDYAISLQERKGIVFDNATKISAKLANMLCTTITNGYFVTRRLYTDRSVVTLELNSALIINGIDFSMFSDRTDVIDRALLFDLPQVGKDNHRSLQAITDTYNQNLPKFLGSIYSVIQELLGREIPVKERSLTRFPDFESLGEVITEIIGGTKQEFRDALAENISKKLLMFAEDDVVVKAVSMVLEAENNRFEGRTENLYQKCIERLKMQFGSVSAKLPSSANHFSKRIKELRDVFEELKIHTEFTRNNKYSLIKVWKEAITESDDVGEKSDAADITQDSFQVQTSTLEGEHKVLSINAASGIAGSNAGQNITDHNEITECDEEETA